MKKIIIAAVLAVVAFTANAQTKVFHDLNNVDTVKVSQKVDVNTGNIYVYAHSTAQPKSQKDVEKENKAFEELPSTLVSALQKEFGGAKVQVVSSPESAPKDGLLVEACLNQIDWGSGALRTLVGFGAGNINAMYYVKVSNAQGTVCELWNHRFHDTSFSSAKGPAVIKVYNKAMAEDLVATLKSL